jgi:RNA polymerase sigma-70 factor (ECF subfamily)
MSVTEPPSPSGPSDEILVRRLRNGDAAAGEELVRRYSGPLLGYLRRMSGSDHTAEELHQAAWVSVLEHLDRFDAKSQAGGFKAWLYRIATNKANDFFRRSGRESTATAKLRLVTEPSRVDPDQMDQNEQYERLQAAIARLPEAQREVVLLRYYSGLKFVEIAELLGCPLNTALGRMHKAMKRLGTLMGAKED